MHQRGFRFQSGETGGPHLGQADHRRLRWWLDWLLLGRRADDGPHDSDTWNLAAACSRWVLPRLRRFRELTTLAPGHLELERWFSILDDMLYFHQVVAAGRPLKKDLAPDYDLERFKRGGEYWGRYFCELWW